ncbi:MAG: PD-(D/E)XK nuclease family protein [Paramuribaculum sp.]|nr:PD-(D/E)XK nuclease family protein [Paramuribaculum sp.]
MNYEQFFDRVNYLLSIAKEKNKQAFIRGENYNVFDIIGLTTNEVKLHSSFIADLLNPRGIHGLGVKPLKLFSDILKLNMKEEDLIDAEVLKEYHIGNISDDYTWGGNIDILIKIKDHFLAIENKINAGDQPKQLLRYKNFIKADPHNTLLYLTLDGHEPSEGSSCGLTCESDYQCISYGVEIQKWLKEILVFSINRPLVRETIQQYLKVIKKLTNQDLEEMDRTELFKVMDKNPDVVCEIVNSQWYYRQHLVGNYIIKPLKEYFNRKGFEWYQDDDFMDQAKGSGFGIYLPDWQKKICVEFERYDYASGFYGVWDPKGRGGEKSLLLGNNNTLAWPYGWDYLGKYTSWNISIVEDIVEGKVCKYIIEIFENLYNQIIDKSDLYPMN